MTDAIAEIFHPEYAGWKDNWELYRDTYYGGDNFIEKYLKRYSLRENADSFAERKAMTYCPGFAACALDEIKNSIFDRMVDISRAGGDDTYQKACLYDIDRKGMSMNTFIGTELLLDLLIIGKVGVYVDMPPLRGPTAMDNVGLRPYIYMYRAEDIQSWSCGMPESGCDYHELILKDRVFKYDSKKFMVPTGLEERYRHLWKRDGIVQMQFYNEKGDEVDMYGEKGASVIDLGIDKIPFVEFKLPNSVLVNVCRHQIALLNLESSDTAYCIGSNFPFYVEQTDGRTQQAFMKPASLSINDDGTVNDGSSTSSTTEIGRAQDVKQTVGPTKGRTYPMGADAPSFIHPSTEPLMASMEKGDRLKRDIRSLVGLAVSQMSPKMASAESKKYDNQGLEGGLAYIGFVLERGEQRIADYWAMYMNSKPAKVSYPDTYDFKSEEERRTEAKELTELAANSPSKTFRQEMIKRAATLTIGRRVEPNKLKAIYTEIDKASFHTADPQVIIAAHQEGLITDETAALSLGLPPEEATKAQAQRLKRVQELAEAQAEANDKPGQQLPGQARGVPEGQTTQKTSKEEKQGKPKRGEGKLS